MIVFVFGLCALVKVMSLMLWEHTHQDFSYEIAVVCPISGISDRPPKKAGLDWIWQRFGRPHGGAEEKREGGQVQRHQVKEPSPTEQLRSDEQQIHRCSSCACVISAYLRIPGCQCNVNACAADPGSSRHQSAQRPKTEWRSWFHTVRTGKVWKVKSPHAVLFNWFLLIWLSVAFLLASSRTDGTRQQS